MIAYSVVVLVLLVEGCPASRRAGPPYDPTSSPRSNGTNSTHISEFTDPATGLNPFLDLEEGGTGEMGRNIVEEEALPRPLSDDFDLQLIEGDPTDRGSSRWEQSFGRRWGNFNNKPHYMTPMLPTTEISPGERQNGNRRYGHFGKSTESDMKIPTSDFIPAARNADDSDYYSLHPMEDSVLESEFNTESQEEEETETVNTQDDTAHPKKVRISENIVISAAIAGAVVAVVALLLAVCWWRQKMKRVSAQGNANATENDIESVISDKTNTNGDVQRKNVLA